MPEDLKLEADAEKLIEVEPKWRVDGNVVYRQIVPLFRYLRYYLTLCAELRAERDNAFDRNDEMLQAFMALAAAVGNPTLIASADSSLEMELVSYVLAERDRLKKELAEFGANKLRVDFGVTLPAPPAEKGE